MNKSTSLLRSHILRASFPRRRDAHIGGLSIVRHVSSSPLQRATAKATATTESFPPTSSKPTSNAALAKLPLWHVLRSYMVMSMSSSNVLLNTTMSVMERMVRAKGVLLNPERNPALNWLLRRFFYDQFCAGENKAEISQTIDALHHVGFQGIILEYAPEVLEDAEEDSSASGTAITEKLINSWKDGMLQTVSIVGPGDFIGLKWSGMGPEALRLLKQNQPPSPKMAEAMKAVCDAAAEKNVKLLPAAEPQNANKAVDAWTLELASKYNKSTENFALVYNTYQCYLKSLADTLSRHLADASAKNYVLGVKLVRGAYLETEQRNLIWDTKAETDKNYDQIATSLIEKKFGDVLKSPAGESSAKFPDVNIMLATHNEESVLQAQKMLDALNPSARAKIRLDFAQLQGMADEVSCALLEAQRLSKKAEGPSTNDAKVYKCVTWGSTKECLHYLLRRAAENRDALSRTVQTRKAMGRELRRRIGSIFGLG